MNLEEDGVEVEGVEVGVSGEAEGLDLIPWIIVSALIVA
ncbi:hypothetical protein ES703_15083 [subsurface metagenome]